MEEYKIVKKRTLGNSGIEVSAIGLGCMGMSQGFGDPKDKNDMVKLLKRAFDLGVTFYDTAEAYGPFTNEELLGEAFQNIRDKVVIATKCGMIKKGDRYVLDGSPQSIRKSLEGSLKRLKSDYVDLYYLHRVDPNTPIEVTAQCMKELIAEGKIHHWGLSEADVDIIRRAHAICPLTAVESEYNMMWRQVESDVLPCLRELGIALVPFSPLAKGFMTGTVTRDTIFKKNDSRSNYSRFQQNNIVANQKLINLVNMFTKKYNATPVQITLAWLLEQYEYLIPIPGTTKEQRLEENIAVTNFQMDHADIETLTRELNAIEVAGERF